MRPPAAAARHGRPAAERRPISVLSLGLQQARARCPFRRVVRSFWEKRPAGLMAGHLLGR
jgi:hypothetical protein